LVSAVLPAVEVLWSFDAASGAVAQLTQAFVRRVLYDRRPPAMPLAMVDRQVAKVIAERSASYAAFRVLHGSGLCKAWRCFGPRWLPSDPTG
jgi:hypothetical protein